MSRVPLPVLAAALGMLFGSAQANDDRARAPQCARALSPAFLVEMTAETCRSSFPDLSHAFGALELEYDRRNNGKREALLEEFVEIANNNNVAVTRSDALNYFRSESELGFHDVFPWRSPEPERREACGKLYDMISSGEADLETTYAEAFTGCLGEAGSRQYQHTVR